MTTVCCVCQRRKSGRGWTLRPAKAANVNRVSHGYCPQCYDRLMIQLASHAEKSQRQQIFEGRAC